jgi:hypothetical protein
MKVTCTRFHGASPPASGQSKLKFNFSGCRLLLRKANFAGQGDKYAAFVRGNKDQRGIRSDTQPFSKAGLFRTAIACVQMKCSIARSVNFCKGADLILFRMIQALDGAIAVL